MTPPRLVLWHAAAWLMLMVMLTLMLGGSAWAHESRPAYLELSEAASGNVTVHWKRPFRGDLGVRLVPHLSSGGLEREPSDRYAAGSYLITTWILPPAGGLSGQTVSVEGLEGRMIDVLVKARFADGSEQQAVLRAQAPSVQLGEPAHSGRLPFLRVGIEHILGGPDHLLFVLGLILIVPQPRRLVMTITGFTLAHSLTLGLATAFRLDLPSAVIEVMVALSILFLGPEILRKQAGGRSLTIDRPWIVAFAFGLLHGLAFASGLTGVGVEGGALFNALLQFNIGVEIGQLAFVLLVLLLMRGLQRIERPAPLAIRWLPAYVVGIAGAAWTLRNTAALFQP